MSSIVRLLSIAIICYSILWFPRAYIYQRMPQSILKVYVVKAKFKFC